MTTNFDFSHASLLAEQYQREMDVISAALLEESLEEREERLSLVHCSWSLSCACFQEHAIESSDVPVPSVAYARP
jgi:hypothetical protein